MSLTECIGNLLASVGKLFEDMRAYAFFLKEFCSALSRFNIEAEVVEAADERKCFFLILISNRCKHRTVVLEMHSRCLKCLIECAVELVVIADSLTG